MAVAGGLLLAFCRVDGRLFRDEPSQSTSGRSHSNLPSSLGYSAKRNVFPSVLPIFLHLTVKLACALPSPRYC